MDAAFRMMVDSVTARRHAMKTTLICLISAALIAVVALIAVAQTSGVQKHKGVFITHLYTGPDGQTHAEEIEAKFATGNGNDIFKMIATTGAELHRAPAGRVSDWHTAPRRQYVITLRHQFVMLC